MINLLFKEKVINKQVIFLTYSFESWRFGDNAPGFHCQNSINMKTVMRRTMARV